MTIREAVSSGGAALKAAGIDTATLDASLLLAEVLGVSRTALIASGPEQLADEYQKKFFELIRRRVAGESTAYILGRKEFYGLEFTVNPSVLVPRPDTETLVEAALKTLTQLNASRNEHGGSTLNEKIRVLDLCTGSGAVAIAMKHEMPELEVWATDISANALETARVNACRLLPSHSTIHFRQGNVFDALGCADARGRPLFSLIACNAPYIPSREIAGLAPEVRNEPRLALDGGDDGLDIIRLIIAQVPGFLLPGGALLLEAEPRQMADIAALLEQAGFCDAHTYPDLSGQQRVIGAVRRRYATVDAVIDERGESATVLERA